ncbi:hypothetical protein Tco_1444419, partial [Tanacetum coccineum]
MNFEAIMLPDVKDLYAKEEVVHRDMNFFRKALSFLICLPQPKRQKRTNIDRDHYGAHDRLVEAYFSKHPMFPASRFEKRFQMSRKLSQCTSAIHQLTYDSIPDARDEYLQMGEATSRLSLEQFCRPIMEIFGQEYLRISNLAEDDYKRLRYKRMHEGARKDVEQAFSALDKKWDILVNPARP